MGVVEVILGILILLAAVAITVAVVLQEGNDEGLGSIAGNNESSFFKGSNRSYEDILSRGTKILGVMFVVLILLVNIVAFFM